MRVCLCVCLGGWVIIDLSSPLRERESVILNEWIDRWVCECMNDHLQLLKGMNDHLQLPKSMNDYLQLPKGMNDHFQLPISIIHRMMVWTTTGMWISCPEKVLWKGKGCRRTGRPDSWRDQGCVNWLTVCVVPSGTRAACQTAQTLGGGGGIPQRPDWWTQGSTSLIFFSRTGHCLCCFLYCRTLV